MFFNELQISYSYDDHYYRLSGKFIDRHIKVKKYLNWIVCVKTVGEKRQRIKNIFSAKRRDKRDKEEGKRGQRPLFEDNPHTNFPAKKRNVISIRYLTTGDRHVALLLAMTVFSFFGLP